MLNRKIKVTLMDKTGSGKITVSKPQFAIFKPRWYLCEGKK